LLSHRQIQGIAVICNICVIDGEFRLVLCEALTPVLFIQAVLCRRLYLNEQFPLKISEFPESGKEFVYRVGVYDIPFAECFGI
jgi:hypothetical protein